MNESRDAILAQIKQARGRPVVPGIGEVRTPEVVDAVTRGDHITERFAREAVAAGVVLHRPGSREHVVAETLSILRETGGSDILAWDPDDLPIAELGEAVEDAGYQALDASLPVEPDARRAMLADLARARVGLTGAVGGIAETGTVALRSGPGRARLTWLLPPIHIVLLATPFIYPTLAAFFEVRGNLVTRSSHLALITGPSRTADIELTLTTGVHGPKEVHIVLVEN